MVSPTQAFTLSPNFLLLRRLPLAKGAAPQSFGSGFLCFFRTPKSNKQFIISGITKDSTGAILGSCTVSLFTSVDNVFYNSQISDPTTGAYSFGVPSNGWTFYAVAYKAGSPDVSGTTVNTLLGV